MATFGQGFPLLGLSKQPPPTWAVQGGQQETSHHVCVGQPLKLSGSICNLWVAQHMLNVHEQLSKLLNFGSANWQSILAHQNTQKVMSTFKHNMLSETPDIQGLFKGGPGKWVTRSGSRHQDWDAIKANDEQDQNPERIPLPQTRHGGE